MLIMMAGHPFSGKTTFVDFLKKQLDEPVNHIDLKKWFLPEYDKLSREEKTQNGLVAWEMSLEVLEKALKNEGGIIIYDTAAASREPMEDEMKLARKRGHTVYYIFIIATPKECEERAGNRWVGKDVIKRYYEKFKYTVPALKKRADYFFAIDNHSNLPSLESEANRIAVEIQNDKSRVHKSE